MAIRANLTRSIEETLNSVAGFRAEDFTISSEEKTGSSVVEIKYNYNNLFYFRASLPKEKKQINDYTSAHVIKTLMSPGELSMTEEAVRHNSSGLFEGIRAWLDSINSELKAEPYRREMAERKREIAELEAQFQNLPDEYLTKAEAEVLKFKLKELEDQLRANTEASGLEKKVLDAKIKKLEEEFDELAHQLDSLRFKNWFSAFLVRVVNWSREPANQKLLKSGYEAAKALLPGIVESKNPGE